MDEMKTAKLIKNIYVSKYICAYSPINVIADDYNCCNL